MLEVPKNEAITKSEVNEKRSERRARTERLVSDIDNDQVNK